MTKRELTLREIQERQPWSIAYSQRFYESRIEHKDFAHALLHVQKAAGKLAAMVDDGDHGRPLEFKDAPKYLADLVNCALRMANTIPSGKIDLHEALLERIAQKNGTRLDEKIPFVRAGAPFAPSRPQPIAHCSQCGSELLAAPGGEAWCDTASCPEFGVEIPR